MNIILDGTGGRAATMTEFLDELVVKDLGWRRRLNELKEQVGRVFGLSNACGQLLGRGQRPRVSVSSTRSATKKVLALL